MVLAAGMLALSVGAGVALAATPGTLSFVGAKVQGQGGVNGIDGIDDVAVSRDGKSVYGVGGSDDAIATFKRHPRKGKLDFVNAKFDGQGAVKRLDGPEDVAVAPDGRSVYVTAYNDDAVVTFRRNRDNGKLQFVNAKVNGLGGVEGLDGAYAVAVSPNGKNVYVTSDPGEAIVTFRRNRDSGRLKFLNAKVDGSGGIDTLEGSDGVDVSRDGRNVYVASSGDNALNIFRRNRDSGRLRFVGAKIDGQGGVDGLNGAYETTVAPDGRNVYVVNGDDALATFRRNRDSGRLKFLNAKFDGAMLPLGDPYDVVASRDGKNVYVAFYNGGTNSGVDTFRRHGGNGGRLTFVNAKRDGVGNVDEVAGIWRLALTRDDRSIYVAAYNEPSVGIFKRHP